MYKLNNELMSSCTVYNNIRGSSATCTCKRWQTAAKQKFIGYGRKLQTRIQAYILLGHEIQHFANKKLSQEAATRLLSH